MNSCNGRIVTVLDKNSHADKSLSRFPNMMQNTTGQQSSNPNRQIKSAAIHYRVRGAIIQQTPTDFYLPRILKQSIDIFCFLLVYRGVVHYPASVICGKEDEVVPCQGIQVYRFRWIRILIPRGSRRNTKDVRGTIIVCVRIEYYTIYAGSIEGTCIPRSSTGPERNHQDGDLSVSCPKSFAKRGRKGVKMVNIVTLFIGYWLVQIYLGT